jgi:hypothetical protein
MFSTLIFQVYMKNCVIIWSLLLIKSVCVYIFLMISCFLIKNYFFSLILIVIHLRKEKIIIKVKLEISSTQPTQSLYKSLKEDSPCRVSLTNSLKMAHSYVHPKRNSDTEPILA